MPEKSEPEHDLPCDVSHSKPDSCAPRKSPFIRGTNKTELCRNKVGPEWKRAAPFSHKVPPRPVFAPAWIKKNSVPAEKATRAPPCRNACISVRAATVTICDNRCSRPPTGSRPDYIPRNHRRDRSSCTPRGRAAGAPHRPRQPPHRPQQYRLQ